MDGFTSALCCSDSRRQAVPAHNGVISADRFPSNLNPPSYEALTVVPYNRVFLAPACPRAGCSLSRWRYPRQKRRTTHLPYL
jgi:hypothetical protein